MATIGAGWKKRDKNDKPYISVSIDKALLPLTIDDTKWISLFPVSEKETENSPDFRVVMFLPEETNKKDNNDTKSDIWD